MFSRKNSSNSAAVSRTTSLSDRGSLDMDRNTSSLQAVHLSTSGRRTMSLEEEDDEDDEMNPWERIRATSGPMSAVSETGSKMSLEAPTTQEVRALRVTNLRRGYTVNDIQRAFEMDPADQALSVEIQGPDSIIVHFADPDQAMRAYFAYLSSTSSIGTVTPWEPQSGKDESAPSSPRRPQNLQNQSSNRNRRSFQGQYGGSNNVLTALSSISAWRSSDKLSTMDKESRQSSFKSHGRTSSRSSLTSKSHDKIPSLLSMTNAQAVSSSSNAKTSAASSMRAASSPGTDNDNAFSSSTTTAIIPDTTTMAGASAGTPDTQSGHSSPGLILQDQQQQQQRRPPMTSGKTSTARRILSGFGSFGSGSSNNKKEKKPK